MNDEEKWQKLLKIISRPPQVRVPPDFSRNVMSKILQKQERAPKTQRWNWLDLFGLPRWEVAATLAIFFLVLIYSVLPPFAPQENGENLDSFLLSLTNGENRTAALFSEKEIETDDFARMTIGKPRED
ncbi:MAG: hypothetical protein HYS58_03410 [Elusimicrobia bacterium]|nr:hypothetical protein [Elusimicrobiota bacterium]